MKLPISWLKDYVDIDDSAKSLANALTISGTKAETVEYVGEKLKNIVVGRVDSIQKHENSDKLFITLINIGKQENIQIVTGATNLYEGAFVPVALDGAVLADGKEIKKGILRGEESNGMLCSINELGFSATDYPEADADGIYIFTEPQDPGADARTVMQLCDEVIDFEITSNRPDCHSIIGLARETAATYGKKLNYPEISLKESASGKIEELISVEIKNPELCPRYIARVLKNVKIAPSPLWLRHRLIMSGLRPVNNIVDITNYVMLEYGQPMHAFDISCISGGKIIVRNAEDGEKFTTLDGVSRELDSSMLVIADKDKAVAVAGVMGGENSKITGNASAILFESANFNGTNVRLTAKKLGLRTDSSSKYEKGLDPELAFIAVNRAVQLVELLGCGEIVKGMVDCYVNKRTDKTVSYSPEKINRLLGTDISAKDMQKLLNRLEIETENNTARVPSFRHDIEGEADIAEEIARLYGYNNINATLAETNATVGKKTQMQLFEDAIRNAMTANGCCEALSFAFESPGVFDKLRLPDDSPLRRAVRIDNPLGEDFSIMRTTTLNSMLVSLSTNYNRRNEEARLFEIARCYLPEALPLTKLPDEKLTLIVGIYGNSDFYDIKGIVNYLEEIFGFKAEFEPEKSLPFMHPGRTASITLSGKNLGFVGELHPETLQSYNIEQKAYVAELDIRLMFENTVFTPNYEPVPRFPRIKRDIALAVKKELTAKSVENALREKGGELLREIKLFDVYTGEKLGNLKSMAFSLTFGAADRTLVDEEVNLVMTDIIKNAEDKLGAKIRDK